VNGDCAEQSDLRRVTSILTSRPELVEVLASVSELRLPDAWVGAGLIRNALGSGFGRRRASASFGH
jgi:hypothetical protein